MASKLKLASHFLLLGYYFVSDFLAIFKRLNFNLSLSALLSTDALTYS